MHVDLRFALLRNYSVVVLFFLKGGFLVRSDDLTDGNCKLFFKAPPFSSLPSLYSPHTGPPNPLEVVDFDVWCSW